MLITGPTGSGKEVVAKAPHACSPRKDRPFVAQNCAGIPDTLLEAELFGYEKGAFTGAQQRKPGRFELADGGTLFLDEAGDLSLTAQAEVLRAIQEGEIWHLGGTKPIHVDVRIIAATNKNLAEAIRDGKFREDLYARLNGVEITLNPLEDRLEDRSLLVKHFIKKHGSRPEHVTYLPSDIFKIDKTMIYSERLREKHWLYNYVTKLVLKHDDGLIHEATLVVDKRLPGIANRRDVNTYRRREVNSGRRRLKDIKHRDSARENLLQVSDMVVGVIHRGYGPKQDASFLTLISRQRSHPKSDIWEFGLLR